MCEEAALHTRARHLPRQALLWLVVHVLHTTSQAPFVSAVLLSEFDIDKGSTLRWCVPEGAVTEDPSNIASLMLPEGAHHRERDWTMFIVNREVRRDRGLGQWCRRWAGQEVVGGCVR